MRSLKKAWTVFCSHLRDGEKRSGTHIAIDAIAQVFPKIPNDSVQALVSRGRCGLLATHPQKTAALGTTDREPQGIPFLS